jgi:hypothetical protein
MNTINYIQKLGFVINKEVFIINDCLDKGVLDSHISLKFPKNTDQLNKFKLKKDEYQVQQKLKYISICNNHRTIITNVLLLINIVCLCIPTSI